MKWLKMRLTTEEMDSRISSALCIGMSSLLLTLSLFAVKDKEVWNLWDEKYLYFGVHFYPLVYALKWIEFIVSLYCLGALLFNSPKSLRLASWFLFCFTLTLLVFGFGFGCLFWLFAYWTWLTWSQAHSPTQKSAKLPHRRTRS